MRKSALEAVRVRIDKGGAPEVDGLTLRASGDHVLVLAAPEALFAASTGVLDARSGELLTSGVTPREAIRTGLLAGAAVDVRLPHDWTVRHYVTWSARLTGSDAAHATLAGGRALEALSLESFAGTRLRYLSLAARRALGVAAAMATGATTLFIEDPLRGLVDAEAQAFAQALVLATGGRRTVIFAPQTSLTSPLATAADEALILDGSEVVAQGAPAEVAARDRVYALRVSGRGADLARLAEARGAKVAGHGTSWTVSLGPSMEPSDLLDLAMNVEAVVLELRPRTRAF